MDAVSAALGAFFAQCTTAFVLYPYRDYVKHFDWRSSQPPGSEFVLSRYRGLAQNPSILALLSTPFAVTISVFVAFRSLIGTWTAAIVAGATHASVKRALKVYSNRLSEQTHRGPVYATPRDAVVLGTARKGAFAWVQGVTLTMPSHILWYGIPLMALSSRHDMRRTRMDLRPGFARDVWDAWRLHSFFALLTAPLRNTCRSVLHRTDYNQLKTFSEWTQNERALWHEAYVVGSRMLREGGPAYFFDGTIRISFMTSLPWALTFATYRAVGAPF